MPGPIFRKAALEKMSSPERLDTLMHVTNPRGWIALLAGAVVIGGGLVWGFLGSAPDKIAGNGILLYRGGIFTVEASGPGTLDELRVGAGDLIARDEVVATIVQPLLEQQIHQARRRVNELEENRPDSVDLIHRSRDHTLESIEQEKDRLRHDTTALEARVEFLERRVASREQLLSRGLVTETMVQQTAQELADARGRIRGNGSQIAQLDAQAAAARNQAQREVFAIDREIENAREVLDSLALRRQEEVETESAYTGRVVSVLQAEGDIVQPGMPLLEIELVDNEIEALVFVPLQGPRIKAGMNVQLSPEGITWEEHGYMIGTVTSVSEGPLSVGAIRQLLHNEVLLEQFTRSGGVYLVEVDVADDPTTPTGFAWTTRHGPDTRIGSGTLLAAEVVVESRAPVTLVIPALREWFGI